MAEDMMMKVAGEAVHRLNERLFREERERQAARVEHDTAAARMQAAEDDVLRRMAERLSSGALR